MKACIDCIPCFFEQAIRAGRMATKDDKLIKEITDQLGLMLSEISLDNSPPEIGQLIYKKVSEISGNSDPYHQLKFDCTKQALELYPTLERMVKKSNDPLLTAIRLAIAGNIIDFGASASFDMPATIDEVMNKDFAIFDYELFKDNLKNSSEVLYIGDNAGETVYDKLLIEQLNKPVIYAVRDKPVINDATIDDAKQAGIDKIAKIISSGTDAPGAILNTCNEEFMKLLNSNMFVIAKGQGNYEGLSNEHYKIFFLLKVKCKIIADHIGVKKGDIVLRGANV
ncbi:MAG: ARMT1-like domain-containing protein [candidate division Zixibacteria bacterium]|nr:ARMT1-like domain-containing protein [candidate division Zixibacteria bacterium]